MSVPLHSVAGFREAARRRLPKPIFDFVDGGAEDERGLRASASAFGDLAFLPRVLRGDAAMDLSTTLAGQPLAMPLILSPIGSTGAVHPDGELAAVLAASRVGSVAICPAFATYGMAELAGAAEEGRMWYQVLPLADKGELKDILERAAALGIAGICVTVDVSALGKRERDLENRLSMPPQLTGRNLVQMARRPSWLWRTLRKRRVVVRHGGTHGEQRPKLGELLGSPKAAASAVHSRVSFDATWQDIAWIRDHWQGVLALKGVLHPGDALQAAELGADVVLVSSHGGRQHDDAQAPLRALGSIVDAVGGVVDVVLDGGVRRGSDVAKALCLGATACSIGRPWAFGLAVDGRAGVAAVLDVLQDELAATLRLLGCPSVHELDASYVVRTTDFGPSSANRLPGAG